MSTYKYQNRPVLVCISINTAIGSRTKNCMLTKGEILYLVQEGMHAGDVCVYCMYMYICMYVCVCMHACMYIYVCI